VLVDDVGMVLRIVGVEHIIAQVGGRTVAHAVGKERRSGWRCQMDRCPNR